MVLSPKVKALLIIAGAIALLAIIVLALPIEVPYKILSPGKMIPAQEWIIQKGTNGQIMTIFSDNKKGINKDFSISQFDRGDAARLSFLDGINPGDEIKAGDTIGYIYSNEILRQLENLRGQLSEAEANIDLYGSGEKSSVVKEAEERLAFAKKAEEEHKKVLNRLQQLYEKDLASLEEFEIAQGQAELNKINIKIAEAQLRTAVTGAKPEQVGFYQSRINSLQREIQTVQSRLSNFTLISPLNGTVNFKNNSDTLLLITDNSEFIVYMPIQWQQKKYLKAGEEISVESSLFEGNLKGEILHIDDKIQYLSGKQVIVASALIKKHDNFFNGLIMEFSINAGNIPLRQFISEYLNSSIR